VQTLVVMFQGFTGYIVSVARAAESAMQRLS
jgi:hypothetical protein